MEAVLSLRAVKQEKSMTMRIITAQGLPGEETAAPLVAVVPVVDVGTGVANKLVRAYQDDIETAMNYISAGTNIQRLGVKGHTISESLLGDVDDEMGHAKTLADRLHALGYKVPCSSMFRVRQKNLSCENHGDLRAVVMGVIEAEDSAIALYKEIAALCDQTMDFATIDIVSEILVDEERHKREFEDFLSDFE